MSEHRRQRPDGLLTDIRGGLVSFLVEALVVVVAVAVAIGISALVLALT